MIPNSGHILNGVLAVLGVIVFLFAYQFQNDDQRLEKLFKESGVTFKYDVDGNTPLAAELSGTHLTVELAEELAEKKELLRLSLSDCQVDSAALEVLARLPNLKNLFLYNSLTDPSSNWSPLLDQLTLENLVLDNVNITDDELIRINRDMLTSLDIKDCEQLSQKSIKSFAESEYLQKLRTQGIPIPVALCRHIALNSPELTFRFQPEDLIEFKPLTERYGVTHLDDDFRVIGLEINQDTAGILETDQDLFEKLNSLRLSKSSIDQSIWDWIKKQEKLESLTIVNSTMDLDYSIEPHQLSQLHHLYLEGVITSESEDERLILPELRNLRTLTLKSPLSPGVSLENFSSDKLSFLSIEQNLTEDDWLRLKGHPQLTTLMIHDENIDEMRAEVIFSLPRLDQLFLIRCEMTEQIGSQFSEADFSMREYRSGFFHDRD
ncbi:hypothetical protein KOR42_16560 [Thalassoglobus neptunius]|uniref:Leucine Rich repeats (2 copies) n=1 Tax=Thalassoglobus neptunius TaxID=1938619 RepID=A0A5C5X8T2_9PLAN|nr:hypothetical protein [Thalassoglobus neptunius]TWT58282.1 hypothetical protein KOR42_16560 [Thalassoglobus neptunius]